MFTFLIYNLWSTSSITRFCLVFKRGIAHTTQKIGFLPCPGFDLTFQKWFVSFPNKNNSKTDLKFCAPWLLDEENFEIHQICILLWKTCIKKNCIKQLCKKSFENKLCERFTCTQKRTISAYIKTLQIKPLHLSAAE